MRLVHGYMHNGHNGHYRNIPLYLSSNQPPVVHIDFLMATMNLKFMQMYHSLEFVESVSSISYISVLLGFLVPLLVAWIIVAQLRTSGSSGFEIPLEFVP